MNRVKDSSDELNSLPTPATRTTKPKSLTDYLALAIATCGVGYLPLAPGTWGSLVGVAIYIGIGSFVSRLATISFTPDQLSIPPLPLLVTVELLLITIITLLGIWAASRTEHLSGRKDPGKVVIDEVAGQLIALLPAIHFFDPGWLSIIAAFLLFRLFDIIKPYPARRLEHLESGLGIMCDDLVAGAYAAVGTSIVVLVRYLIV
jgi:phosphatidylglycerophosphatase A